MKLMSGRNVSVFNKNQIYIYRKTIVMKYILCLLFCICISCDNFSSKKYSLSNQDSLLLRKYDVLACNEVKIPRLISLPLGSIRPTGWLEDRANLALNGVTGHLDEYSSVHRNGWNIKNNNVEFGSKPDGTGWILEQSAYWLDGAIRLATIMQDSVLLKKVSIRLDEIIDGVLNGGETFIYWKSTDIVKDNEFNSWSHSHIARALLAYYQLTGENRILQALCKVYDSYPLSNFPSRFDKVSGFVNIDPMYQTYLFSGNKDILVNIQNIVNSEAYKQQIRLWNNEKFPIGHAVVMYENIRIPLISYLISGDEEHFAATLGYFKMLEKEHLLPCGIASSEEWVAGIGSTRNIETCNVSCAPLSYQLAYEITGEGKYGDKIETIFFNAAPVAVSNDYKNVIYYQSLNKVQGVLPQRLPFSPSGAEENGVVQSPYMYRPKGHKVLCCVGNVTRALPNYIANMWMSTPERGLSALLYGPNKLNTIVGKNNVPIEIDTKTNYPFSDDILFEINPKESVVFPLNFRIPGWAKSYEIILNGEIVKTEIDKGFVTINKEWNKGDIVELKVKKELIIESGVETSYPDSSYFRSERENIGRKSLASLRNINNPYQVLFYGPLLFSYPIPEDSLNKQAENICWKYALDIKDLSRDVKVIENEMPDLWLWNANETPIQLEVKAKLIDWNPTECQPLPDNKIAQGEEQKITLIPYGCTHYRITMFPVCR